MSILENITKVKFSPRGGGCELDLSEFGYDDEFLSAYQNYLGGGMLGAVNNDCTIDNWQHNKQLIDLAQKLREYYLKRMYDFGYIDEYNEELDNRPISYICL